MDETILPIKSKDRNGKNLLETAINNLVIAGKQILIDPRESVAGEPSARAVADYLQILLIQKITEAEYSYKTKNGTVNIRHEFDPQDYSLWKELIDMLRNPKAFKGQRLAAAKAWEVLHERSARFELTNGSRFPPALTFSWAASHILKETGVVLGKPHSFSPNELPFRYCFIP